MVGGGVSQRREGFYLVFPNAFRSECFANRKFYEQVGLNSSWYFFNTRLVCPFQFPLGRSAYDFVLYRT